ncbi:MAG: hypothetical protein JWM58_3546 [Rhizobium sp.]|nr:hypothetical protein [Rhizobium sp.]
MVGNLSTANWIECMPNGDVITARGIRKSFGSVQALTGADLSVGSGEVVGLVGHNGAGKSTLINALLGILVVDEGELRVCGAATDRRYSPSEANRRGARCVFQELSLCPNLDIAENTRVTHRGLRGRSWRRNAERVIGGALDRVFPGHGIPLRVRCSRLSIAERQMAEVARAFSVWDAPPKLVVLDEPTSALGEATTRQLLDYIRRAKAEGISTILVTHRLDEIYQVADRIVIMKDGAVIAAGSCEMLPRDELVRLMGGGANEVVPKTAAANNAISSPLRISLPGIVPVEARAGEVIGFAGLDGHGQRDMLVRLKLSGGRKSAMGQTSFVAGDRQADGVFPLWSIAQNLTIASLERLRERGFLSPARERNLAESWRRQIGIRSENTAQLLTTLSGGNQQKVLFARALAADAAIVLLDDPMRGVDIATKHEVYGIIRQQAEEGRTFVWYSTELSEFAHCDRVYVFRDGAVVACIARRDVSAARIIEASFGGGDTHG